MVRELIFLRQLVVGQWRTAFFSKKSSSPLFPFLPVLLPIVLYKYFQFLAAHAQQLIQRIDDNTLTVLFFINLAAWFLPARSSQRIGDQLKRNGFFPFNTRSLFVIRLLSLFPAPTSILALIFSALSFYPVFYATDFITAALYATGLFSFAVFFNFTIVNLLNLRGGQPLIFSLAALILIGSTFLRTITGVSLERSGKALNGILLDVLFDNSLIFNLVLASAVAAVSLAASFLSLRAFLGQETAARNAGQSNSLAGPSFFDVFKFHTKYGLLIKKDLGYVFRLSSAPYVSLLITIYYAYFLTLSGEGGCQSLSVFLSYIFIPHALMFFNFFGFDKLSAIERHAVMAIDPAETIKIKNLSAVICSGSSFVIILPVILFKFSPVVALAFLLKWCLLTAGYLIAGNLLSVIYPFDRRNKAGLSGKLLFGYAGAVMIISFVLVLTDSLGQESMIKRVLISCVVLLVYIIFYFLSLFWIKKNLHRYWETIRQSAA